jgi:hypothetical protein
MSDTKKTCLISRSVPAVPMRNRRLEEYLDHLNILNEVIYGELLKVASITGIQFLREISILLRNNLYCRIGYVCPNFAQAVPILHQYQSFL